MKEYEKHNSFALEQERTIGQLRLVNEELAVRSKENMRLADERLRAQEALQTSETRFRTLTDNLPGIIYRRIMSPDGKFRDIYVSSGLKAILGVDPEEVMSGKVALLDFIHPEDRARKLEALRDSAERIQPLDIEVRKLRRPNGDIRWWHVHATPTRLQDGNIQWDSIALDVTDKKIAEHRVQQVLATSAERFRSIFSAVSDGIIIANAATGRFVEVNEPCAAMFGYTADELIGRDISAISSGVPPYRQAEAAEWLAKVTTAGPQRFDWHCKAKDGRLFWGEISLRFSAIGGQRVVLAIVRDVTEQRAFEAQLRQAQKMEAIGLLTGGIAHDFNNLLAIIHGNLEFIKDRSANDPELDEMAGDALRAAARGASLTHQLLAYSRQQPLAPKTVDIDKLVSQVTQLLRRTLGDAIEINISTSAYLWKTRIDPHQLENALVNLAVNARDAMPDGGILTIESSNTEIDEDYANQNFGVAPGPYVLLAVTDNGTGMSQDIMDRVLEPFFTTKAAGQGSGLGLSMVFGFVKQSGGHLKIYSEPGLGTTVQLFIPKAQTEEQHWEAATSSNVLPRSIAGEVVLVLEDDAMVRKFAIRVLTELGYCTMQAADGPEALSILRESGRIDLLLTDIGLPKGMNGPAVAREAQSQRPDLKFLYMSGYAKDAIVNNGLLDDGLPLLTKPFPKAELARKIREILDNGGQP